MFKRKNGGENSHSVLFQWKLMEKRNEMKDEEDEEMGEVISGLSLMPEEVVVNILSWTTPADNCRSSAVSRTFHAAAQSSIVWQNFLPVDWKSMVSRRKTLDLNFDLPSSSAKDILFSLSNHPLLIDDGFKSFSLDKRSGKKCIMVGGRNLIINCNGAPGYWTWESHPESRFGVAAVLLEAWWVEVRGKISCKLLCPATTYGAYFVFKMNDQSHGFDIDPANATVGIANGENSMNTVGLNPYSDYSQRRCHRLVWMGNNTPGNRLRLRRVGLSNTPGNNMTRVELAQERRDGWFEIELGEFHSGDGDDEVEMVLKEVNSNYSKSGLIVQGIEIRPIISSLH